jgi:hypothetical protein
MKPCTRRPVLHLAVGLVIFFFLVPPLAAAADTGATSCECKDCRITITIRIAFFGADDAYISRVINEVQDTWNGPPENPSASGDCNCPFEVKVVTKKVTDCAAEKEYHCIEVTNYTANPPFSGNESVLGGVRNGTIDPKTSGEVTRHRGYLYPPGTSTGAPLRGWWSDAMSTPYNGQKVTDFAHEAGHLMGLADRSGGIMDFSGMTSGRASQGNIDDAVKNLCGDKPCPDRCCCGNARVDWAKGEECDPLATPPGCITRVSCCPVCCRCQVPACDPEAGEYPTEAECTKNCSDKNEACHINYYTGCWDCTGRIFIEINDEYQSTRETIWKANESEFHTPRPIPVTTITVIPVTTTPVLPGTGPGTGQASTTVRPEAGSAPPKPVNTTPFAGLLSSVNDVPVAGDFLASERINVRLPEGEYHVTTAGGNITDSGDGIMTDPTVNVYSDQETLELIAAGDLTFESAVSTGRVRLEGVGFVNSLKFTVSEYVLKIRAAFGNGG